MLLPSTQAPAIKASALDTNGKIIQKENWIEKSHNTLLIFWPYDFTFVCPTELLGFSEAVAEFKERNTEVIGVSIDSVHCHAAWSRMSLKEGGIGSLNFPILGDDTHAICNAYGVRLPDSPAFRAVYFIDKEGIIRHASINDNMIGRSVGETLRIIDAFLHYQKFGEVCPFNWKKGQAGLTPTVEATAKYIVEAYDEK